MEAKATDKKSVSIEDERHSAVMKSLSKVTLGGLLNPDREMELELLDDDVGERKSVVKNVHGILGNWKQRGFAHISVHFSKTTWGLGPLLCQWTQV